MNEYRHNDTNNNATKGDTIQKRKYDESITTSPNKHQYSQNTQQTQNTPDGIGKLGRTY